MKNATTTKKEYEYYRLAKEAIDRGEAENALFNIRKALERVVKVLCGQCNIDTYKVDLCDLIQKIREANMIDEKEEALLHRIRIKSNCGVHAQEETEREATIDDAEECLHLLNQVLKAFEGKLENTEKLKQPKRIIMYLCVIPIIIHPTAVITECGIIVTLSLTLCVYLSTLI